MSLFRVLIHESCREAGVKVPRYLISLEQFENRSNAA